MVGRREVSLQPLAHRAQKSSGGLGSGPGRGRGCIARCGTDSKAPGQRSDSQCFRARLDGQLSTDITRDCFLRD